MGPRSTRNNWKVLPVLLQKITPRELSQREKNISIYILNEFKLMNPGNQWALLMEKTEVNKLMYFQPFYYFFFSS